VAAAAAADAELLVSGRCEGKPDIPATVVYCSGVRILQLPIRHHCAILSSCRSVSWRKMSSGFKVVTEGDVWY